jgi:alkanesulfonate monooxygenase SsuD/methylene tetrahydromethanopterin reductase-like flavin-dependent oxidoreductase (luciferase family)
MRVCLMVEGQEGVTWEQWVALAQACERAGLEGLFRSDHYTGFHSAHGGALDCWATLSALAAVTDRIHLGSLVSPATFRHPSVLARMAVTADQVAPGRIELGIGAGWNEDEHVRHGFPFPPLAERLSRFAEQVEIVHRQWTEEEFDFSGEHYELRGSRALPKPRSKPNLIVGGSAKSGTIGPAVRFADEYNTVFATADECRKRKRRLDEACERAGREPLVFSLMTGCIVGSDRDDLEARRGRLADFLGRPVSEVGTGAAAIVGTVDEAAERLRELERAGVERVMLQHLLHEDVEMVELLGELSNAV